MKRSHERAMLTWRNGIASSMLVATMTMGFALILSQGDLAVSMMAGVSALLICAALTAFGMTKA